VASAQHPESHRDQPLAELAGRRREPGKIDGVTGRELGPRDGDRPNLGIGQPRVQPFLVGPALRRHRDHLTRHVQVSEGKPRGRRWRGNSRSLTRTISPERKGSPRAATDNPNVVLVARPISSTSALMSRRRAPVPARRRRTCHRA
jgi:hypothetical protein